MAGSADGFWGLLSSPAGQGLLAAGLGALGGRTALGGISRGGLLGLNVYNQAKQGALDEQRMQKQDQLFDMQMQQRQQAQEQALARQNYLSSIGQVTSPVAGAQPNQFDPMKWISMGGSVDEAKNLASSGNWGKAAVKDYKEVRMPDGSVQIVGFDEFGNRQNTGAAPYKAPEFRDLGGQQVAIDPVSLKPVWSGKKSMTPGEAASNAVAWANVGVARDRLALERTKDQRDSQAVTYQQDAQGNLIALPTKIAPGMQNVAPVPVRAGGQQVQGKGAPAASFAQQYSMVKDAAAQARELIPKATSSGLGAARDATAAFFGKSTDAADAAAKLDVLGGWMTSTVPRFEGPQSDKDVMQYKAMAANVANRSLPASQRLQALDALETFMDSKAASFGLPPKGKASPASAGGVKFMGFE